MRFVRDSVVAEPIHVVTRLGDNMLQIIRLIADTVKILVAIYFSS